MDMNTKQMRILLVSCLLLQACTNATSPRMQCNEKCAEKTNTCYLTQGLVVNAQSQSSNAPPATQYPPSSPRTQTESEPNDTFSVSIDTGGNGISDISPTESRLMNAGFSSPTDVDVFLFSPANYERQLYFKTQNSATCKVYVASSAEAGNNLIQTNSTTPPDGVNYLFDLTTSPKVFSMASATVRRYAFVCSGNSGDSYSIQMDPTSNSYNQYLQAQGLYTAPGTVGPLTATVSIQTCESYKNSCYKSCKYKIF